MSDHETASSNFNKLNKVNDNIAPRIDLLKIKEHTNKFLSPQSNPEPEKEGDHRLHDILMRTRINPFEPDEEEPVCLEIIQDDKLITIATRGNFSMIIGKAKSRKTFSHNFLMAAYLTPGTLLGKFKATPLPGKGGCILFDTEQGKIHTKKVARRVLKLSGHDGSNFYIQKFREESLQDKIDTIEYAVRTMPNIGLVVIDGIRDLSPDINDSQQSLETATRLLQLSSKYNLHIIVVLHQNKGDNAARGHLGSELQNKAESTISVTKEGEISIIAPEYCRDKDFEPFAFGVDINGIPELVNYTSAADTSKPSTPLNTDPEIMRTSLINAFKVNSKQKYSELVDALIYSFAQNGLSLSAFKVRAFITHFESTKMIIAEGTPGTKSRKYGINILC